MFPLSLEMEPIVYDDMPEMKLIGASNIYYVIEASTNFIDWIPTVLIQNTNSAMSFIDPGSTNFMWRYYRARLY